jgi:hypothetical protein
MDDPTHISSRTPLRLASNWAGSPEPAGRKRVMDEIMGYPPKVQIALIGLIDTELDIFGMTAARASFREACNEIMPGPRPYDAEESPS